jgi:hypothetical protein
MVNSALFWDRRTRYSSPDNGLEIAESFLSGELETVRLMEQTRSACSSTAMILSSSAGAGEGNMGNPL